MYEDVNKVLNGIKEHLESNLSESFTMQRSINDRYATFVSESYTFDVMATFIQARVREDFSLSIQDRIDSVVDFGSLQKQTHYKLSSKSVENREMPIEYFLTVVDL
ncbi:hypothetical protein F0225_12380 [Vibrio pectenicida]|uniref:Uncharacterized protein n=2 Tax=Vibrio pectenicida TaxID=62763 RepID=A0A7Y3ZZS9_9VIBR|nr:hypothetical protein [Vibrio pectenicida]